MSNESKNTDFSFIGDSLNESVIKSLKDKNGGVPPKVDVTKITISQTGQVVQGGTQSESKEITDK